MQAATINMHCIRSFANDVHNGSFNYVLEFMLIEISFSCIFLFYCFVSIERVHQGTKTMGTKTDPTARFLVPESRRQLVPIDFGHRLGGNTGAFYIPGVQYHIEYYGHFVFLLNNMTNISMYFVLNLFLQKKWKFLIGSQIKAPIFLNMRIFFVAENL